MNKLNQLQRQAQNHARGRRRPFIRILALGWLVTSCGCANSLPHMLGQQTSNGSRLSSHVPKNNDRVTLDMPRPQWDKPSARISDTAISVAEHKTNGVVPVSYDEPLPEVPVDPACVQPGQLACGPDGTNANCNVACAPEMPCGPMGEPVEQYWNDQEYIYDGGDREPRVQVNADWRVNGLDSQDTVAHYETLEGKLCVSPSNRVPIYAPRFGAVRKSTAPILSAGAVGPRGMLDPRAAVVKASNEPIVDVTRPEGPKLRDAIAPIDSFA